MGAVWLARQLSLETACAIKFLHEDSAAKADIRARFEQEAKVAAQIRSPNVVQILDHGVWEDTPFIAMELLEGEDLDERLRRVGALDPRETASIVGQVARALGKAHAAGLVHRDLKPANIFLVRDEDREIAKVLDFGIAKRTSLDVGESHTKTGSLLGSPHYMSPEQARGLREVDHRTDLWALGVIAFRCVVGQQPFQSESLGDLFMKIIAEPIPVPSQLARVPPGFDAFWARAAARDPNARFQSAKELADALNLSLGVSMGSFTSPDLYPSAARAALGPPGPTTGASTGSTGHSTSGAFSASGAHGTQMLASGNTPAPGSAVGVATAAGQTAGSGISPQTASAVASEVQGAGQAKPARRGTLAVVGILVFALVGAASFVALRGVGSGTAAPGTTSTAAPAVPTAESIAPPPAVSTNAPVVVAPTPQASAAPESPPAEAPSASPVAPTAPPSKPAEAPKPAAAPKPARAAAKSCDPPFTVDASGHHHPKPECM
jgi:serine/threonine-protein kinase